MQYTQLNLPLTNINLKQVAAIFLGHLVQREGELTLLALTQLHIQVDIVYIQVFAHLQYKIKDKRDKIRTPPLMNYSTNEQPLQVCLLAYFFAASSAHTHLKHRPQCTFLFLHK